MDGTKHPVGGVDYPRTFQEMDEWFRSDAALLVRTRPGRSVKGIPIIAYSHPDGTPGTVGLILEKKDINGDFQLYPSDVQPYQPFPMAPAENPVYTEGVIYSYTFPEGIPDGEYRFAFSINGSPPQVMGEFICSVVNTLPSAPTSLFQLNATTGSAIPPGTNNHIGTTAVENAVTFSATVTDPDVDPVKLEVEVRKLTDLDGQFNELIDGPTESHFESEFIPSGGVATITFTASPGDYHWRARTVDKNNTMSPWQEFPDGAFPSATSETDFDYGFEPYPYGYNFPNFGVPVDTLTGGIDKGTVVSTLLYKEIREGDKWDIFRETYDPMTARSRLPFQRNMRQGKGAVFLAARPSAGPLAGSGARPGQSGAG